MASKTREQKRKEFRKTLDGARKQIRTFIIMMVAIYIGFQVMTSMLKLPADLLSMAISIGLAVVILVTLLYTVYQIKIAKALFGGSNEEDPEQTLMVKMLKAEVNDLKKEIAWIKSIRES